MTSPPQKRGGRPGQDAPANSSCDQAAEVTADRSAHADVEERAELLQLPVAYAVAHRPAAHRRLWLTVVTACPACGHAHHHRGTENAPAKGVYRAGCGGRYWIAAAVVPLPHAEATS